MTFLFLFVNQNRETFKPSFILYRVSAIQRGDTRICVVQRGLQCNSVWNQSSPWGDGLHGLWSDTTPISSLTTVCQKVCLIYYAPSQFYSWTARRSLTVGNSRFVLPWRSDWQQQHWELPLLSGFGKASAKLSSVHHLSPKGRRPLPVHSLQQIIQLIWKKEKRSIRCVFSLFIFSYTLQEFHNSAVAAWTQSNLCELNPLLIFPKN